MTADLRREAFFEHATLFGLALVVGLAAGLVAVGFEEALSAAARVRWGLARTGADADAGPSLAILFSALTVGAGVALVRRVAPEAAGSGIPRVEAALHHGQDMGWFRVLWVKFTAGVLAIGGGLTLGREGPTVQMGAALGRAIGGPLGDPSERSSTLLAAGAGAGLAAAFNAPLAGTVFVLEEMRVLRTPRHALAALIACVSADAVCRALLGSAPQLGHVSGPAPSLLALPALLVLGAAAGALGALFNRGLLAALDLFVKIRGLAGRFRNAIPVFVGGVVGLTGWLAPSLLGPGDGLVENALRAPLDAAGAASVFVARFALTLVSYATGAAGGLFAPLLVLGAEVGVLAGRISTAIPATGLAGLGLPICVVVGMGSLFAGSVRAPATGVLLMIEMTGSLTLLIPLVFSAVAADLMARALGARPIYEALLDRELARAGSRT